MNTLIRPWIVTAVVGLLGLGVFGLRFACSPADLEETRRREELEQLRQRTLDRLQIRRYMVQELIAQRCTLAEAMVAFQELDHEWPDYRAAVAIGPSEGTVAELAYRYVLQTVQNILHDRPDEAAAVIRRLEKEYERLQDGEQIPSTRAAERPQPRR